MYFILIFLIFKYYAIVVMISLMLHKQYEAQGQVECVCYVWGQWLHNSVRRALWKNMGFA